MDNGLVGVTSWRYKTNKGDSSPLSGCYAPAKKETYRKNDFVYLNMENIKKYITIDPEIQNGQPVFSGTRVPVETLFWHLEKGISIDEFLEDFPSVTKEQAIGVIGIAHKILTSGNIDKIYEAVA